MSAIKDQFKYYIKDRAKFYFDLIAWRDVAYSPILTKPATGAQIVAALSFDFKSSSLEVAVPTCRGSKSSINKSVSPNHRYAREEFTLTFRENAEYRANDAIRTIIMAMDALEEHGYQSVDTSPFRRKQIRFTPVEAPVPTEP